MWFQDMDVVQLPMDESTPDLHCVAVFDGHGGPAISQAVYVAVDVAE